MNIRPSSLPKLAECRCYYSKPSTSDAAARGTSVDSVIRTAWQTYTAGRFHESNPCHKTTVAGQPIKPTKPEESLPYGLSREDRTACAWALDKLLQYSNGAEVYTKEQDCIATSYMDGIADGAMDAAKFANIWAERFSGKPLPVSKYVTIPGGKPYSKLTISKK